MKITSKQKKRLRPYLIAVLILFLISVVLTLFKINFLSSLRIVFGSVFVLFLPGYVITKLYLKELDIIETITLSFALSIATVPLIVFYLNKLGMKINTLNSFLTILGVIAIAVLIYKVKTRK